MIGIQYNIPLSGTIHTANAFSVNGSLSTPKGITVGGSISCNVTTTLYEYDEYSGTSTVTPSLSTQTLNTANKLMGTNITINPIPGTMENNYGKITWDGSKLRVS